MTTSRLTALLLVLLSIVILVWFRPEQGAAREPRRESPIKPTQTTNHRESSEAQPVDIARPQVRASPETPPLPDAVRAVLPDLKSGVSDWREFTPETLTVHLAPGLIAPFRVTHVEKESNYTVLTARLDPSGDANGTDSDHSNVFLVSAANSADRWMATVMFAGVEYQVDISAGRARVDEVMNHDFWCDTITPEQTNGEATPAMGSAPFSAADGSPVTVDVLFVYNRLALADRNNDVALIENDCLRFIGSSNAVLRNSQVTSFVWRYAGLEAAPDYPATDNVGADLTAMRGSGPLTSFVSGLQLSRKADQVVLLAGGSKSSTSGAAWIGGPYHHSAVAYPYPTSSNGTRSTTVISPLTICHELAHNFGCRHDRDDPGRPGVDGDGKYYYGHKFVDTTSGEERTYVTLMAGNGIRIPFFSNPDVLFRDQPTGVPVDAPRAAFNARVLAEAAGRIAAASTGDVAPVFTTQPSDQSVQSGQTLSLSATASGEGVSYYWGKNGQAIEGAEGTTLTIIAASAADAGRYQALAINLAGGVFSREATVTVTSAPTPPPPASSGGSSGGGGGGSTGPFMILGATALLVIRHVTARETRRAAD